MKIFSSRYIDYLSYAKYILGMGVKKLGETVSVLRNKYSVEDDIVKEKCFKLGKCDDNGLAEVLLKQRGRELLAKEFLKRFFRWI